MLQKRIDLKIFFSYDSVRNDIRKILRWVCHPGIYPSEAPNRRDPAGKSGSSGQKGDSRHPRNPLLWAPGRSWGVPEHSRGAQESRGGILRSREHQNPFYVLRRKDGRDSSPSDGKNAREIPAHSAMTFVVRISIGHCLPWEHGFWSRARV